MRDVLGGRYRIVSPIGKGGMGAVYEAIDERTSGKVAVKVVEDADDAVSHERFRREARVAASLSHPHVVRVTDFQDNEGEPPFLVMERVDGVSLRTLVVRDGPLEPRRACAIAAQVLSGLSAGHAQGIVHRDVKPSNILVSTTPAGDVAKIVDFGLARELDDPRKTLAMSAATRVDLTMRGEALGTLGYLAPEQLAGDAVGDAADVYAVGATLFYMIEGRGPFEGLDRAEYFEHVLRGEPPRARRDSKLAAVAAKAMARLPAKRFDGARAMIEALGPWLDPAMAKATLRKTMRAAAALRHVADVDAKWPPRWWLVPVAGGGLIGVIGALAIERRPPPSAAPPAAAVAAAPARPADTFAFDAPVTDLTQDADAPANSAPSPARAHRRRPSSAAPSASVVLPREVPYPTPEQRLADPKLWRLAP